MSTYKQILVMGAGAVGGYFGGRIAERTSSKISLVARGRHLQAIQQKGLTILSPEGNSVVETEAFGDPRQAHSPDLILFTVKSYDTDTAIQQIHPVMSGHTQVLTIQNGIENYEKLVQAFGEERVIQGFCKVGAGVTSPGIIEYKAFGVVTAGERDGRLSDRIDRLQKLFSAARIPFNISKDIRHEVWVKFAWNAIFNMLTALADVTVEKLFKYKESEELCGALFNEIKEVAATQNIELAAEEEHNIMERAKRLTGFETSTYQDRKKGKRLEFEAFAGAIVRLAEKHNIAVPCNKMLYALLKHVDNNEKYRLTESLTSNP